MLRTKRAGPLTGSALVISRSAPGTATSTGTTTRTSTGTTTGTSTGTTTRTTTGTGSIMPRRGRRRRRSVIVGLRSIIDGRAVHDRGRRGIYDRSRGRVNSRLTVHHSRTTEDVQAGSHKVYDVRGQTDATIGWRRAIARTRENGGPDDESGDTDGGFQNLVLHFSSPVFMVLRVSSALSDHKTI